MKIRFLAILGLVSQLIVSGINTAHADDHSLTIYSTRQNFLLQPMLNAFTQKTGITTRVLYAKNGLIERIALEGENTPADLFLASNLVQLSALVDTGVTEAVNDSVINKNILPRFRDQNGQWIGLGLRTRVIYTNKKAVKAGEITDYLDLARPDYRGKICIRALTHPYNVGLVAYMLRSIGEARTQEWLKGLVANLARDPQGNDRAQIRGANAGECDIAIANNYYLGVMKADPEQAADAANVVPIMAALDGKFGTMSSVSGGSLIKYSKNKLAAIALLQFLSSPIAQKMYTDLNHEMSVRPDVADARFKDIDTRSVAGNVTYRGPALHLIEQIAG